MMILYMKNVYKIVCNNQQNISYKGCTPCTQPGLLWYLKGYTYISSNKTSRWVKILVTSNKIGAELLWMKKLNDLYY